MRPDKITEQLSLPLSLSSNTLLPSPFSLLPFSLLPLPSNLVQLWLQIEGSPQRMDLPGGGSALIAFMSFAVSRGFGATHPLIALADRLHDEHKVRMGPLTTFYELEAEDAEDRKKLELAYQSPAELATELTKVATAIESDAACEVLRAPRRCRGPARAGPRTGWPPCETGRRWQARAPGVCPVMRRRRASITARERWATGPSSYIANALNSQAGMALATSRVRRIIDLIDLCPGRRLPRYWLRHQRLRRPRRPKGRARRTTDHPGPRW